MKTSSFLAVAVCTAGISGFGVCAWSALGWDDRPAAAGDSILAVPACVFNEVTEGYDYERSNTLKLESSGSSFFYAPLNLPQGSIIKKIILMCMDNNEYGTVQLHLKRKPIDGAWQYLVTASSTGHSADWRVFPKLLTSNRYVNHWKFSYYLRLDLPSGWEDGYRFFRALVVYAPPST